MAKDDKAALKAAKKQERAAKRQQRKQTWSQMWQAFNMQRKQDKALIPIMLGAFLGMGLLFFLIGLLFSGEWFMLILGLGIGALLAMFLFTRRLERDMYKRVEDQIAGGVPVYEIFVGNGEDEVPVSKLRNKVMKLPRNFNKNETYENIRRIEAMDSMPGTTPGMPKGPMPHQAQNMAGMNRRMRRAQQRKKTK